MASSLGSKGQVVEVELLILPPASDPLEKGMATHSSILAWRIPWTEEPGGLQSMGGKELDLTKQLTLSISLSCLLGPHPPQKKFFSLSDLGYVHFRGVIIRSVFEEIKKKVFWSYHMACDILVPRTGIECGAPESTES